MKRRAFLASTALAGTAGLLAACSPASNDDDSGSSDAGDGLTFRLWDENAKPAYEESLAAFTKDSGIDVTLELVSWDDYWTKLPLDVASGDMADVYWMNSANYVQFADSGDLLAIDDTIDTDSSEWEDAVVELYTRDGHLWGVPQSWDSIAVFYNKKLTDDAEVDPSNLVWAPDGDGDTLIAAGKALTTDSEGRHPGDDGFDPAGTATFGFNAMADRQAIIGPFLASGGAEWQVDDKYAFDSAEGVAAMQYVADLINVEHVAPSAADTNDNGDYARDLFTQGKLGIFQSGPYSLPAVADGVADSFEWGIAPLTEGPAGRKSLVHGVVAVGNAKSEKQDDVKKLLEWLGSADGQAPLAEKGVSFPGVKSAQDAFLSYWKDKGVDVSAFVEAAKDPAPADTGAKSNAGLTAALPHFQELMTGRVNAEDALKAAQEDGNAAME